MYEASCLSYSNECLLCTYGYRLVGGVCLDCVSKIGGFVNCRSECDNNRFKQDNVDPVVTPPSSTTFADNLLFPYLLIVINLLIHLQ
jgi:hypothetical protein